MKRLVLAIAFILASLGLGIRPAEAQTRDGGKLPMTEYLVFQRGAQNPQIFVRNRTTGIETQVTSQGRNFAPVLCDDGTLIYASDMKGPLEIYRRPLAGGFPVRLSAPGMNMADLPRSCLFGLVWFSRVSYDEAMFALGLTATQPAPNKSAEAMAASGIYKVPLASGTTTQFKSGVGLYEPAISPDATKVAIAVQHPQTGRFSIKIYSSSTGVLLHETMTADEIRYPAWINEDRLLVQAGPIANARIGNYTISSQTLSVDTSTGWAGRPFIVGSGKENTTVGYDNMMNIETASALHSTAGPITSVGVATSHGSWVRLPSSIKPAAEPAAYAAKYRN